MLNQVFEVEKPLEMGHNLQKFWKKEKNPEMWVGVSDLRLHTPSKMTWWIGTQDSLIPRVGVYSISMGKICVQINRPSDWWHGDISCTNQHSFWSRISEFSYLYRKNKAMILVPEIRLYSHVISWYCVRC